MLKKLTKYELNKTWKIPALICGIILGTGLLLGLLHIIGLLGSNETGDTQNVDLLLLISFPLIIILSLYLIIRYYKSLYASEGYFSFTLPASIAEVVSSKMFAGTIWGIAVMAAYWIALNLSSPGPLLETQSFGETCMAISFIALTFMFIVSNLWISYFSVTVGKSWKKHKLAGTIVCYFFTCFVVGIIALILSGLLRSFLYRTGGNNDGLMTDVKESIVTAAGCICAVILCFILKRVSISITEKTLNLE